ncbi:hypothetical protein L7F22_013257 [Adiantum nelumboides]|nr:hypothetical protein [Adiantum nelumboides]
MDREEEIALLRKQMEEMQRALSHPEVQQLLHTLDKGKEKQGLESGEIPQDSAKKEPQIVEQSQREAQVGLSQKREKQNEDKQRPDSPQFSFMKDLDDIVPEQDMNLEPEREEAKNVEVQSKRRIYDEEKSKKRIPVDDKSKSIHKKKHQKKKTFKAGDKDVKFEAYNGRRNNDKALAFIRQFEVAFAEGNFKERSKLRHVSMYLKGTASSWWLTQILEGKKPKDWSAFKEAFYSQFLPPDFEQEVRKEWDRLSQWEDESVPQYVDRFWDVLLKTDGQSEIANSVVQDLLKSYISDQRTQWERYLPLVEFAYSNMIHSSTGKAPFEIVEGAMKIPPFLSTKDKIFEADEYTRDLDTDFAKVRETLQKSQEWRKKAIDRHRRDLKLKKNDWMLLRFEKARLRKKKGKERLFPKLSMRYYGPFQITERMHDVSFRLRLPETWKIHNAFHVSLLKSFKGDVPDDGESDEQP